MLQAPWTEIGRLQQEIMQLKNELNRKADSYEISSLRSKLDSLKYEFQETHSVLDNIRSELQILQENQLIKE